jgi:hypothetical protein
MWLAYRLKTLRLPHLYDYGFRVDYELMSSCSATRTWSGS